MISNELKIELYPNNKPTTELKTSPVKEIINGETLGHSFDINDNLSFLCYNGCRNIKNYYDFCTKINLTSDYSE